MTAWALWLAAMVMSVTGVVLWTRAFTTDASLLGQGPISTLSSLAITVTYGSVGLLLRLRRPEIVIGWLLLGIGLLSGLDNLIWSYFWLGLGSGSQGPVPIVDAAMVSTILINPLWVLLLFLIILLFPDGHLVEPSWRPVAWLAAGATVVFGVTFALAPGRVVIFQVIDNPFAPTGPAGELARLGPPIATALVVMVGVLAVWSIVVRYRLSDEQGRRQLKWLAWGSSIAVAAGIAFLLTEGWAYDPSTRAAELVWVIFAAGSAALPIAVVIAILRERLYDIDRLISRTFVYGLLTAILAGLYSALIRLFNAVFVGVTGESSEVALVLTTLILATTFTPIKQRLEHVAAGRLSPLLEASPAGASPGPADMAASPTEVVVTMSAADLDRRMEEIARRVGRELLAERDVRPDGRNAQREASGGTPDSE
jgi:hypothetical protein